MWESLILGVRYHLLLLIISIILIIITPSIAMAYQIPSDRDVEWLAYNIYHEARGEPLSGKIMVAVITINRVEDKIRFPNTIHDVVTQPSQFSWYWDGKSDQPKDPKAYKECLAVSRLVYDIWKDGSLHKIIGQLDLDSVKWYHNEEVLPRWAHYYQFVTKIGKHLIYKDT